MTLSDRILSHLNAVGRRNTLEIAEALAIKRESVTMALARMARDRRVERVGREFVGEGQSGASVVIWSARMTVEQVHERQGKPGRKPARKVSAQSFRELTKDYGRQQPIIREERRKHRDHQAQRKDALRDALAADVEAWIAAGNEPEEVPGYRPAAPAMRVYASDRRNA